MIYFEYGILGEEYGLENFDVEYVWVLDFIDGIRVFIIGLFIWGSLIGLCMLGWLSFGMMLQFYIGE